MLQFERDTSAPLRHLIYALDQASRIARAVVLAPRSRASWGRFLNLPAFGVVIPGRVYRSGSPRSPTHFRHLSELGIKTVICVRRGGPASELRDWCARGAVELRVFDLVPNGEHDLEATRLAAQAALEPSAEPVLVCCDGGRHHAGMVVAVLRLRMGCALETVLGEYYSFASPSPFADNVLFIVRAARDEPRRLT